MANLLSLDDIRAASRTISGHVERTPTVASPGMSALLGVPVTLKLELLQRSGSFKPRGVAAKLLSLSPDERDAGVVAVSGGNHGIAVAEVANAMDVRATVVMAKSAPPRSIDRIRAAGAELRLTEDMTAAFALLDELVADGKTLVHPFDDPTVLAGQGTVGLELAEDAPPLTDVLVSMRWRRADLRRGGRDQGADAGRADLGRGDGGRRRDGPRARRRRAGGHRAVLHREHAQRAARVTAHARPRPRAGGGGLRRCPTPRPQAEWWPSPRRARCGSSRRPAASSRPRCRSSSAAAPTSHWASCVCGGNVTQRDVRG